MNSIHFSESNPNGNKAYFQNLEFSRTILLQKESRFLIVG